MHADSPPPGSSSDGKLVGRRSPVMAAVGLRSDISKCFLCGFRKVTVLKTKEVGSATENPVAQARPLALNRASPMPSLTWQVVVFAPPNNGMHRTQTARFIRLKANYVVLSSPVMPAVGLRSDFPKVFFAASKKSPFLKTKEGGSATEIPVVQARPLHFVSLNRASPIPSLSWHGQQFAPPNNGMHRTHPARFIGRK